MTEENKIKRYYIIFHFRTHNSAYKGSTYTVYGRGGDKHYAKLFEEGEQPHLYNSAKTAEKSAKNWAATAVWQALRESIPADFP